MSDYRSYPAGIVGPYNREPDVVQPPRPPGPADLFREMADRIERNDPAEFAGAILVVPPVPISGGEWEPIEMLLVNPRREEWHFWSTIFTKVQVEAGKWKDANTTPPPGRMR